MASGVDVVAGGGIVDVAFGSRVSAGTFQFGN
jgi:hypothetical protein